MTYVYLLRSFFASSKAAAEDFRHYILQQHLPNSRLRGTGFVLFYDSIFILPLSSSCPGNRNQTFFRSFPSNATTYEFFTVPYIKVPLFLNPYILLNFLNLGKIIYFAPEKHS